MVNPAMTAVNANPIKNRRAGDSDKAQPIFFRGSLEINRAKNQFIKPIKKATEKLVAVITAYRVKSLLVP